MRAVCANYTSRRKQLDFPSGNAEHQRLRESSTRRVRIQSKRKTHLNKMKRLVRPLFIVLFVSFSLWSRVARKGLEKLNPQPRAAFRRVRNSTLMCALCSVFAVHFYVSLRASSGFMCCWLARAKRNEGKAPCNLRGLSVNVISLGVAS
jgi:hypothetical protein